MHWQHVGTQIPEIASFADGEIFTWFAIGEAKDEELGHVSISIKTRFIVRAHEV